jgi:hypothetical protein
VIPRSYQKKSKASHNLKQYKLNQCDIDILGILRGGAVEVLNIHENLEVTYSDQEISLNLSWLERKGFIKKLVFSHPAGFKTVSYQLDHMGKEYVSKN